MFTGEYNHSIDAKGRVIIPSKFREQLGEEFVVTKGLDGCLFVYPKTEWEGIEEKFRGLPSNAETRRFMRFFFAGAAMAVVSAVWIIVMRRKMAQSGGKTQADDIRNDERQSGADASAGAGTEKTE